MKFVPGERTLSSWIVQELPGGVVLNHACERGRFGRWRWSKGKHRQERRLENRRNMAGTVMRRVRYLSQVIIEGVAKNSVAREIIS